MVVREHLRAVDVPGEHGRELRRHVGRPCYVAAGAERVPGHVRALDPLVHAEQPDVRLDGAPLGLLDDRGQAPSQAVANERNPEMLTATPPVANRKVLGQSKTWMPGSAS